MPADTRYDNRELSVLGYLHMPENGYEMFYVHIHKLIRDAGQG